MNSRQKINLALQNENTGRPPLWVMRQAGRYLPEYRALRKKYSFLEMVKSPELAVEVSLQPLRRFALDAAIVFSDILVVPEAMGQPYHFREQGGIGMDFRLKSEDCLEKLDTQEAVTKLLYVRDALCLLRQELDESKAMLGFCGSPWTLACYMIDGGSSPNFPKTVDWAKSSPLSFAKLMEKLTEVLIGYVNMQAQSGVDAIQIFDSWNGLCPDDQVNEWSLRWIDQIAQEVSSQVPVILYAKAPSERLHYFSNCQVSGISIDHETDLAYARNTLPSHFTLQGNLDPALLETDPETVCQTTLKLLKKMEGDPGHILNLGHGIRPQAKVECMEALVRTVTNYSDS
ncbi:MAG: uroporphyrinogen decarboxylase [Opitutales bacterium]|nr:uroporphyrinogen decarboxylase [Opitutales bacterium]